MPSCKKTFEIQVVSNKAILLMRTIENNAYNFFCIYLCVYIYLHIPIYCKIRNFPDVRNNLELCLLTNMYLVLHEHTEFFTTRHGLQSMHPLRARMRRLFTKVEVRAEKLDIQDRN